MRVDADLSLRATELGISLVRRVWPLIRRANRNRQIVPGSSDGHASNELTFARRLRDSRQGTMLDRPVLYVVTPIWRPHNMPAVAASLEPAQKYFDVRWLRTKYPQHDPWGDVKRNVLLDRIEREGHPGDWIRFLDDDNLLHPAWPRTAYQAIRDNPGATFFLFDSDRLPARPDPLVTQVDTDQLLVGVAAIRGVRWPPGLTDADHHEGRVGDWHFVRRLIAAGHKPVCIPGIASQYNALRRTDPTRFIHTGDLGDVIYSLPIVLAMGGGILHLVNIDGVSLHGMAKERVELLRSLLLQQQYIEGVETELPDSDLTIDLNLFRKSGIDVTTTHLVHVMAKSFGFDATLKYGKWLGVRNPRRVADVVISRSARYHNPMFPWAQVVERYHDRAVFVGTEDEHTEFVKAFGDIPHHPTADLLAAAEVIAGCKLFIGNQSCPLAIAEALKKRLVIEVCRPCPNCCTDRNGVVNGWDEHGVSGDMMPTLEVHTVTWNDDWIIERFCRYYAEAAKIVVHDSGATDRTVEFGSGFSNVVIQPLDMGGELNTRIKTQCLSTAWHGTSAGWVAVVDCDEFLTAVGGSLIDGMQPVRSIGVSDSSGQGME